jgi:hypothetical protein
MEKGRKKFEGICEIFNLIPGRYLAHSSYLKMQLRYGRKKAQKAQK